MSQLVMNKIELIEHLRQLDEITLLELLDINAEELVDAFLDKVDERQEYLYGQFEAEDSEL